MPLDGEYLANPAWSIHRNPHNQQNCIALDKTAGGYAYNGWLLSGGQDAHA